MASIITGMMSLESDALGRLGSKTVLYYATTSLVAILIGLFFVNLLQPGIVDGEPARNIIGLSAETDEIINKVGDKGASDIADCGTRADAGLDIFQFDFRFFRFKIKRRVSSDS